MFSKLATFTAFTVVGILIVGGSAWAQEAGTQCKPLTSEQACKAATACRWVAEKRLNLPNGSPVQIPAKCTFKPGVAAAIKAAAAK